MGCPHSYRLHICQVEVVSVGPYLSSAPKIGLLLRIRTFPRKRSETAPKIGHILYFFAKVKSAATPSADIEFGLIEVDNARVNTIKQR